MEDDTHGNEKEVELENKGCDSSDKWTLVDRMA